MEITTQTETTTNLNQEKSVNEIELTAPGRLRVIKRNGKVVAFEEDKIKVAVTKAFLAIESGNAAA
ncbi:MAG: ATP cone domain-containing protein, partial [SAR86 cluster bacterium]|nr:ATP cone domain-containing protein [SAR86 cluster bacterium]